MGYKPLSQDCGRDVRLFPTVIEGHKLQTLCSQGESDLGCPVAHRKVGVNLALGEKKRIEKVYKRELHLDAMSTMSQHL